MRSHYTTNLYIGNKAKKFKSMRKKKRHRKIKEGQRLTEIKIENRIGLRLFGKR